MSLLVETTYRDIPRSDAVDTLVQKEISTLERFFNRIISCRTLIEKPYEHHVRGAPFRIRIELGVPGKKLIVNHTPTVRDDAFWDEETRRLTKISEVDAEHKHLRLALHDAFHKACRRLQDYARRKSGAVKTH